MMDREPGTISLEEQKGRVAAKQRLVGRLLKCLPTPSFPYSKARGSICDVRFRIIHKVNLNARLNLPTHAALFMCLSVLVFSEDLYQAQMLAG